LILELSPNLSHFQGSLVFSGRNILLAWTSYFLLSCKRSSHIILILWDFRFSLRVLYRLKTSVFETPRRFLYSLRCTKEFAVFLFLSMLLISVSQPPGRSPVLGPGINYTGPRDVLLEFVILVF